MAVGAGAVFQPPQLSGQAPQPAAPAAAPAAGSGLVHGSWRNDGTHGTSQWRFYPDESMPLTDPTTPPGPNGLTAFSGGSGGSTYSPPPYAPPPLPGAEGFNDPSKYGWGNFSPGAQAQSGFFNDLAAYHANQGAPQLQRTGVDWSGMGGGSPMGQPAPQQQGAYPTMPYIGQPQGVAPAGAPASGLNGIMGPWPAQSPPPAPAGPAPMTAMGMAGRVFNPSSGQPGTSYSTGLPADASNQRVTPGAAQPSLAEQPVNAGAVTPQFYQAPSLSGSRMTPAMAQTGLTESPVRTAPTPQYYPSQPAPAPQGGGSSSQFANPMFQQAQAGRAQSQGVMGELMSPDMYANPQQGVEASGRSAELTALNRAADPNLTNTKEGAQQQQSRNVQGATMAATTAPNLYNTPGAAQQDAARQQQQSFLQRLSGDMNGGQPSLAEMQLRRGTSANVNAANALAAAAGPANAGAASRRAMNNAAVQGQSLAGQTAELRAKEYAQARGEMGGALTNLRGQDITNQGQGFQNITATQDRAVQQAIALRSADLQAAGMSYDNAIKQAQLEQSGAQGIRAGDIQRVGQEYTNTTAQAQLASQHALQTRAQDLQAAGMSYDNAFRQAQLEVDQNKAQLSADMQQRGLNIEGEKMGYGMGLDIQNTDLSSRQHYLDLMAQKYGADRNLQFQQQVHDDSQFDKYLGAGVSAAATALPYLAMLSDKRQKTDIEDADPKDLSDFLGKLKESTFRYKDEKHGKGDHVGVMAQDVEKSRVGKTIIVETPSGKALDMKKALGALLAAGAAQEKRLRKLETR